MNIPTISIPSINQCASSAEGIRSFDAVYKKSIAMIARSIFAMRHEKSVILLAGPSGSGKTTTAHILESYLDAMGAETHTISMDNYFSPLTEEQLRLAAEGKIDFESPDRMDIPFMNEQLADISACKPVHLPEYDFTNSQRLFRKEAFTRKDGEIVLLEGIHALNPSVILLPEEKISNVYISVRTRVETDKGLLHPSNIRLLRRIIRDRRTRARTAAETVAMFDSVERGEQKYIAPYKHRAHFEIDSFHDYELCLYKDDALSALADFFDEPRFSILHYALTQLHSAPHSRVGEDALIREFIGSSDVTTSA